MAGISAATVKQLRHQTGLPMMECKRALESTGGDIGAAVEELRKQGKKTMAKRADRETSSGRMGICASVEQGKGAMIELQCESASVMVNDEFVQLTNDLAKQLAEGPGAATPEELLAQASPSKEGQTLKDQLEELQNRIREVFRLARIVRFDGPCGGYAHHTGEYGVLTEVDGGDQQTANDVSMHAAAMRPAVVAIEDLDPADVAKEREILAEAARTEGKPEKIIEKMVDGRMRTYYEAQVLNEQPFVKDDKLTVGKYAAKQGGKIVRFVVWRLGEKA